MRSSAVIPFRAAIFVVGVVLAGACSSPDGTVLSESTTSATAAPAPTTATTPATAAPTTVATTITEPDPEPDVEQIAWEAIERYLTLIGDTNPNYDPELLDDYLTGSFLESMQALFAERLAAGAVSTGRFEVLDLVITLDEPERIEVLLCGLDGTSSVDAEGVEVAPARTSGALYGIVLVAEGSEWKAAGMNFVSEEPLECVEALLP